MAKLNDRQIRFAYEYIVDLNATQAAIRAGYSPKTAYSIGQRTLKKVEVLDLVAKLKLERLETVKIDADHVLRRLVEIDELDVADIFDDEWRLKPISQWPKPWRRTLSGLDVCDLERGDDISIIKKIKWPDKVRNLELIGKHIDVQAFKDKIEQTNKFESIESILDDIDGDTIGIPEQ